MNVMTLLDNSDDKKKIRACTECHKSKNKCVYAPEHHQTRVSGNNHPRCERCVRLKRECIPHLSRQGKRKLGDENFNDNGEAVAPVVNHGSSPTRFDAVACASNTNTNSAAMLSNQAHLLDMVENSNLQQLSNSLNLNMFQHGHGSANNNFSQQMQMQQQLQNNNNPLVQGIANNLIAASVNSTHQKFNSAERVASSESLTLLLSRALNENGMGVNAGNNVMGGGDGSMINTGNINNASSFLSQDVISQQADLLSNTIGTGKLDMAKLNMMISHLASNSGNHLPNISGNNTSNGNAYNPNMGNSSTVLESQASSLQNLGAQQPSASALLMLPGASGNFNSMNNPNNANNNNTMGSFHAGTGTAAPYGRSYSMGHGPSLASSSIAGSDRVIGRRSSMPLDIGNGNNNINNASSYSNNNMGGGNNIAKKQKKAQFDNNPQQHASASNTNSNTSGGGATDNKLMFPQNNFDNSNNSSSAHPNNNTGSSSNNHRRTSSSSSSSNFLSPEDTIGHHIARACAKHSGRKMTSLKNHYGLQCQVREWISMALMRRSFGLLGKACMLANRCGIHMDRILCGVAEDDETAEAGGSGNGSAFGSSMGRRMNYLLSTLLEPRAQQTIPVQERHMLVPHLSKELLSAVGCQSFPAFEKNDLRNRWIFIRETHCGVTRFYCSPAFERNILCWTHMSQIYEDNLADIYSLIFVKDDFRKFLACNAHQISAHSTPGMPPKPVHAPKTNIRLLGRRWGQAEYSDSSSPRTGCITKEMIHQVKEGNAMTLEMDLLFVQFPTMDKTTYFMEFFHHDSSRVDRNSSTETPTSWPRNLSTNSLNKTDDAANTAHQYLSNNNDTDKANGAVSESPGKDDAPTPVFDDIIDINDVLAKGDIDVLLAILD